MGESGGGVRVRVEEMEEGGVGNRKSIGGGWGVWLRGSRLWGEEEWRSEVLGSV